MIGICSGAVGLVRTYAMSGESAKARAQCQEFFRALEER